MSVRMSVNDLVTDVPSIITVLSSISTLFVAILTYFNLRIVSKQTNFLEKQVLYQRLDSYPLVQVKEVKYVGNSIHLTLKNVGKGPATHLAISNQFSAMNLSKTGQDSEGRPIVNEKGELPVKDFKFVQKVKDDKGKTMHPSSGVNLLEDESGKASSTLMRRKLTFSQRLIFVLNMVEGCIATVIPQSIQR